MRFGIDKKSFFLIVLLIVGFNDACSQSKEMKVKESRQHAEKALALRSQGDVQGAVREQLKAVELNPDEPELLVNLIGFYRDINDLKKAKETSEKALKLIPNNAWVNYFYGEILEKEDKYQEALKYRSRAVELDSNNPLFLSNLASVQEELKDAKSARENFGKALQLDENFIFALVRLGQLEEDDGNTKRAAELYEKVVKISPEQYQAGDEIFVEEARIKLDNLKNKKSEG